MPVICLDCNRTLACNLEPCVTCDFGPMNSQMCQKLSNTWNDVTWTVCDECADKTTRQTMVIFLILLLDHFHDFEERIERIEHLIRSGQIILIDASDIDSIDGQRLQKKDGVLVVACAGKTRQEMIDQIAKANNVEGHEQILLVNERNSIKPHIIRLIGLEETRPYTAFELENRKDVMGHFRTFTDQHTSRAKTALKFKSPKGLPWQRKR